MRPTSTRLLRREKVWSQFCTHLKNTAALLRSGYFDRGLGGGREPAVVLDLAVFNAATWVEKDQKK